MQWYVKVLREYVNFSGRARRTEFWMFTLFNVVISVVLGLLDGLLGTAGGPSTGGIGVLGGLYTLAVLLPSIAVSVRRLHDTDRSGWWLLIALVPFVGLVVLLVLDCLAGTTGPNRFGLDPKQVTGMGGQEPGPSAAPA